MENCGCYRLDYDLMLVSELKKLRQSIMLLKLN